MAECEEGLSLEIHVGEAFGNVVFVLRGHLVVGGVDGQRHFAAGIDIAKDDIGDGIAPFFACPPRFENGRGLFGNGGNGEGTGVHFDDDRFRIGRQHRFDQFLLIAGESLAWCDRGLRLRCWWSCRHRRWRHRLPLPG